MNKSPEFKELAMDIAIALVFATAILIAILIYLFPGIETGDPYTGPFLKLTPKSVDEIQISDYTGIQKIYTLDLSEAVDSDPDGTLFIYLHHTSAVLEIDGQIIEDTTEQKDKWHIGHTPGGYWMKIHLSRDYEGKEMTVTLTPIYRSSMDEEPEFLVTYRLLLLQKTVLPHEGLLFVLSIIAILMGIMLILLAHIMGLMAQHRLRVFYLGTIAVTAGTWKISGLSIIPLLLDYYYSEKLFWYIGNMSYMLMLVLSLRLLDVLHGEKNNLISKCCCITATFSLFVLFLLQLLNILDLHEVVIPYGIAMGTLHLLLLLQKPGKAELLWFVPSFVTLVIDAMILLITGRIHHAPFLITWIIIDLFVSGFMYIRKTVQRERLFLKMDEELRDARIQTMIGQIRPHFIFNTLASIHMICASDPPLAMEVIKDFNNYLQANFTAISTTKPVPFETELEHTEAYLSVESALYIDKLHVDYDIHYTGFSLPSLTLQPLVENSIKHGIGHTHKPEHICIRTKKVTGGTEILVEDDGPGIDPVSDDKNIHIGISNAKERLRIMCGGKLSIGIRPGGGTVARIFIPD